MKICLMKFLNNILQVYVKKCLEKKEIEKDLTVEALHMVKLIFYILLLLLEKYNDYFYKSLFELVTI